MTILFFCDFMRCQHSSMYYSVPIYILELIILSNVYIMVSWTKAFWFCLIHSSKNISKVNIEIIFQILSLTGCVVYFIEIYFISKLEHICLSSYLYTCKSWYICASPWENNCWFLISFTFESKDYSAFSVMHRFLIANSLDVT